jgi:uncharacterized membrane protein
VSAVLDTYLLDWANLLLRWAHVVTAIAWIGSSFYFVFLDSSLTAPTAPDLVAKGVDGELWAVHGGGFYHPQKYVVAPPRLPEHLHWFYWESYATWMTGFGLFTVLYLFNAGSFLVDKNVHDWTPAAAIATALGMFAAFWFVYDAICRVFGRRAHGELIVGVGVLIAVAFASWLACRLFPGRAAFLIVGAMLATAMTGNVAAWIIPGQRKVVAQIQAGEPVDPIHGWRGKQRSVHNTYFTLPVIVAMLSNHYGWLVQGAHNWIVLVLLMLAGALIRYSFVARHKARVEGRRTPWQHAVAGTLAIVGLVVWLAPAPPAAGVRAAAATTAPAGYAQVRAVIDQRCAVCHGEAVQQKGVSLQTPELLRQHAQQVYQQAVVLRQMPFNNATGMTDDERALLKRWYESGAPVQ